MCYASLPFDIWHIPWSEQDDLEQKEKTVILLLSLNLIFLIKLGSTLFLDCLEPSGRHVGSNTQYKILKIIV